MSTSAPFSRKYKDESRLLPLAILCMFVAGAAGVLFLLLGTRGSEHLVGALVFWIGFGALLLSPTLLMLRGLVRSWRVNEPKATVPNADGKDEHKTASELPDADQGKRGAGLLEKEALELWKTAVQVQQHFNDLELRIRNFAVTALVGALGATAFALKEHYVLLIHGLRIQVGAGVPLAGMVGWWAFYFMDRHWYHRLLLGAVRHTLSVEKAVSAPAGLSTEIGKFSATRWWRFEFHSSEKLDLFYSAGLLLLAGVSLVLALSDTSQIGVAPVAEPQSIVGGAAPSAKPSMPVQANVGGAPITADPSVAAENVTSCEESQPLPQAKTTPRTDTQNPTGKPEKVEKPPAKTPTGASAK